MVCVTWLGYNVFVGILFFSPLIFWVYFGMGFWIIKKNYKILNLVVWCGEQWMLLQENYNKSVEIDLMLDTVYFEVSES